MNTRLIEVADDGTIPICRLDVVQLSELLNYANEDLIGSHTLSFVTYFRSDVAAVVVEVGDLTEITTKSNTQLSRRYFLQSHVNFVTLQEYYDCGRL